MYKLGMLNCRNQTIDISSESCAKKQDRGLPKAFFTGRFERVKHCYGCVEESGFPPLILFTDAAMFSLDGVLNLLNIDVADITVAPLKPCSHGQLLGIPCLKNTSSPVVGFLGYLYRSGELSVNAWTSKEKSGRKETSVQFLQTIIDFACAGETVRMVVF
ncbi:hypothetical protein AVEN_76719-1 [Araneus ventricosus]|uniref:Uncharacterized protein n=1 Tax=Araneus ventricosus TaxID=182803 RepID=A0A4Y2BP43_ARAVE|nr:hypothetical protein AVEN_76719-1 [Araneus ventricosus]